MKSKAANYLETNKIAWNHRALAHVQSDFYNQADFLKGANTLKAIEQELLGDIRGLEILHLQCHFGQDSLSMARMGAQVCGLDFSEEAIRIARETSLHLQLDAQFVCADVYDAPLVLPQQYDRVFSSYGTIGWLPDIVKWAEVVQRMLRPGGQFIFVEFHPALWMLDNDLSYVQYSYFHDEPIVETLSGSYASREESEQQTTITWNHGLAEVIQALLNTGLELKLMKEYPYSPYPIFDNMIQCGQEQYTLEAWGNKFPWVYALEMHKPA